MLSLDSNALNELLKKKSNHGYNTEAKTQANSNFAGLDIANTPIVQTKHHPT